jgi:hypothetical protein
MENADLRALIREKHAEAIRLLIRQKVQDGRLPLGSIPRAFGRPGNWQKCDACEETMPNALLMKEVYPSATYSGMTSVALL